MNTFDRITDVIVDIDELLAHDQIDRDTIIAILDDLAQQLDDAR